jgi:hypothetical protein
MSKKKARLGALPEDFEKLGQKRGVIEPWEDGHRTSGKFGEYEWWYFDSKLDDGSSLVIVFFTQPVTASTGRYAPSMIFSLTKDGKLISDSKKFDPKDCSFSREKCSVKLGNSYFSGDLDQYEIHYESDRIVADVTLSGNIRSWRPETGRITFGEKDYFAWLPSVPEGSVNATVSVDGGEKMTFTGSGYHDHNWGNKAMFWLMHHWYWGRAKVGEYQAITSYITARKKYGYEHFTVFMLAKNGEIIGDRGELVKYAQSEPEFDTNTNKTYYKRLEYDYNDGKQHYKVIYRADDIIEYFNAEEGKNNDQVQAPPLLMKLVKIMKLAPSYIRMVGNITIERIEGDSVVETVTSRGIWEQMYFGLDEDV